MRKFEYYTIDVAPEKMDFELNDWGKNGWEFIQLVVMQRQIPVKVNISGLQPMQIEIQFKLIFKKEVHEREN